jgi:hypothetical protein
MTPTNNATGGPAFPFVWDDDIEAKRHIYSGMTLRDYFAAKAMQSHLVIGFVSMCGAGYQEGEINKAIAKAAYDMADAMIVAGGKV